MEQPKILLSENAAVSLAFGGLVFGLIFVAIVFRTNFCAMGSISDMVSFGDKRRFRAWLLAAAIALIGAQAVAALDLVDLSMSMYLAPVLVYCFSSAAFRTSGIDVFSGIGVGLCVVAGWVLTGLAYDEFAADPVTPASLTFVRPAGDALDCPGWHRGGEIPGAVADERGMSQAPRTAGSIR